MICALRHSDHPTLIYVGQAGGTRRNIRQSESEMANILIINNNNNINNINNNNNNMPTEFSSIKLVIYSIFPNKRRVYKNGICIIKLIPIGP